MNFRATTFCFYSNRLCISPGSETVHIPFSAFLNDTRAQERILSRFTKQRLRVTFSPELEATFLTHPFNEQAFIKLFKSYQIRLTALTLNNKNSLSTLLFQSQKSQGIIIVVIVIIIGIAYGHLKRASHHTESLLSDCLQKASAAESSWKSSDQEQSDLRQSHNRKITSFFQQLNQFPLSDLHLTIDDSHIDLDAVLDKSDRLSFEKHMEDLSNLYELTGTSRFAPIDNHEVKWSLKGTYVPS